MTKSAVLCLTGILLLAINIFSQSSKGVTSQVKKALLQQMVDDREIEDSCVREEGASKVISVSTIELNGDNKPEYMVSGNGCACYGARRCNIWIYRKSGNDYEKIFDGFPADGIYPKKRRAKGYADLQVMFPVGNSTESAFFKFDGRRYREQ